MTFYFNHCDMRSVCLGLSCLIQLAFLVVHLFLTSTQENRLAVFVSVPKHATVSFTSLPFLVGRICL